MLVWSLLKYLDNFYSVAKPITFAVAATEEGDSLYWTSSATGLLNLIYTVDFINGIIDGHSAGLSYAVRLVRGGRRWGKKPL